jgi:hypothetical protein
MERISAKEFDERYDKFVKPMEREHPGEYAAAAEDGRLVLAPSLPEVVQKASEAFGPGYFVYKVGERAVGHWR